ncbi:MAG: hypothetical protein AAB391_00605 [Patescibacteria group bacterium]
MSFEQIPLFEESRQPGKAVLIETSEEKTARESAETKAAFARIQEVVKNTPSWEDLKRNAPMDDGRSRHTRKLGEGANKISNDTSGSWMREHEARQDERAEQFSSEADRPDLASK